MSRRPYQGISDSQANADALAHRDTPYSTASEVSFRVRWDWHRREPTDLREAVRMVRRAYADEVPAKLHEGPDSIGEGGTPKMTPKAEGYLFGSPQGGTDKDEAIGWYHAPFRAHLDALAHHGDWGTQRRAAIVSHVTIGSQGPQEAAIAEGVPSWCAKDVAEIAIRGFLRGLTDMKLRATA